MHFNRAKWAHTSGDKSVRAPQVREVLVHIKHAELVHAQKCTKCTGIRVRSNCTRCPRTSSAQGARMHMKLHRVRAQHAHEVTITCTKCV